MPAKPVSENQRKQPAPDTLSVQSLAGLDPSQLERRGKSGMFVVALALYVVVAAVVVWFVAVPQGSADEVEVDVDALRGARMDEPREADAGSGSNSNSRSRSSSASRSGNHASSSATSGAGATNSPRGNATAEPPELAELDAPLLDGRYAPISFDLLASFDVPDPWGPQPAHAAARGRPSIPDYIHGLDGKPVAIVGFASSHNLGGDGRARDFMLFRTRGQCCFGDLWLPHELVLCHVKGGEGLDLIDGVPMRIKGVLRVEPEYEGNILWGMYRLEAETATLVE